MLELKNLSYSVEGKEILNNVNLTIDDGKFIVITGPNGGGKSTLAKIIAGILTPTKGQILFDGEDITSLNITERARKGISFAFQQPVRFKGVTVKDLIDLAAGEKLTVSSACMSLSGGELKRIEIATVLARKTKLSLFDEPEAGIDLWSFKNLIEVFERMRKEIKGSIIIISHQERILNIADEIIVIADGQLRSRGTSEEILPKLLNEADGSAEKSCRYYTEEK